MATLPLLLLSACADAPPKPIASPAAVSNTPRTVDAATDTWTFEDKTGVAITTPTYRIFTTITSGQLLDRLPLFAEMAVDHYTSALAPLPRPTAAMETYIMSNRPQWTRLTQRLMGEDADVYLKIQRGGFAARGRAVLYFIGQRDTLAIAAHEGWHQYTQTVFKNPLPIWLEEGIATYMEGFRWSEDDPTRAVFMPWANVERFDMLRNADRDGRLMPLTEVLTATPQDLMSRGSEAALIYYAQVWTLAHFLHEGEGGKYAPALAAMLKDAAAGDVVTKVRRARGSRAASLYSLERRGPDLLLTYAGDDLTRLSQEYDAFIRQLVRVGAKQRIVGGLSPIVP